MGVVGTIFVCSVRGLALTSTSPAVAMPGIEKLPIEETLEDSPQVIVFRGGFS